MRISSRRQTHSHSRGEEQEALVLLFENTSFGITLFEICRPYTLKWKQSHVNIESTNSDYNSEDSLSQETSEPDKSEFFDTRPENRNPVPERSKFKFRSVSMKLTSYPLSVHNM